MSYEFQEVMNRLSKEFGNAFRSPSYKYYTRDRSKDRYFYTTEKCNHKGKSRYMAGIYRHLKTKNQLKLVKRVGFAKRYKADDWAKNARDKEAKQKATSPEVA